MKTLPLILMALCCALPSQAQESAPAGPLTPDGLADSIVMNAPLTDAAFVETYAVINALAPSSNLPDPEVEGELLGGPAGVKARWNAGLSWSLDWPGVYAARSKEAEAESSVLRLETMAEILERTADVRALLIDCVYNTSAIKALREIEADNRRMMEYVRKGAEHGQMTLLDVRKLEIEQARVGARISELTSALDEALATLNGDYDARLDTAALAMLHYGPADLLPLDRYVDQLHRSPALQSLRAKAEAASARMSTAKRERLPGIGVGYVHAFEDGNHFNGGALSLSIPIFSSKGKMKAAETAVFAAESVASVEEEAATRALMKKYDAAIELKKRADALMPVLAGGSEAELMRKAFEGGQWSLLQYLQERAWFLEARMDFLAIERDLRKSLSELSRGLQ